MRGAKPKDFTGMRFGKLTAIRDVGEKNKSRVWLFSCDCGGSVKRVGSRVASYPGVSSCGCALSGIRSDNGRRNKTHGWSQHKLYGVWRHMMRRCYDPKCKDYPIYGGREIKVCDEWHSLDVFCNWGVSSGHADGLTIERMNVNGGYSPSNCTWVPNEDQARNTRKLRMITHDGKTHFASEWARILGVPYSTIRSRIRYGWTDDRIIGEAFK